MRSNPLRATAHPLIYEIDTWPWLERLGRVAGRPVTLATVPTDAWDGLAAARRGRRLADGGLGAQPGGDRDRAGRPAHGRASGAPSPTSRARDVVGSPYCIRDYVVDERLGGPEGLAAARGPRRAAACV